MRTMLGLAIATLATFCVSTGSTAETKLTYGAWAPDAHPNSVAAKAYFDRVTQETKGQVTFEGRFNGTIVNIRNSLPGLKDRIVDLAYVTGSLFPSQMPIDLFITDNLVMAEPRVMTAAINETLLLGCKECGAEWRRNGVLSLLYVADAPYYIQCKEEPKNVAFFAGKQVRAVSAFGHVAETLGAAAVNTAPNEVYEAMQRGAVACAIGGGFWQRAYSLWDVTKYVVDFSVGQYNNASPMTVNLDVWRELSEDVRKALLDSRAYMVATAVKGHVDDDKSVREVGKQKGVTWIAPSKDLVEVVERVRRENLSRVVASAEAKGIKIGARLAKDLDTNIAKWSKIVADLGDDWGKYEQALQREIFSKVTPTQ
jgi:TRAP-type transport system periplasmic protein